MKRYLHSVFMVLLAVMPVFISSCSDDDDDSESSPTQSGKVGNHEYVDLGLESGTKWATCNVGASTPTEYGDYFNWGAWGSALSAVSDSTTQSRDYHIGLILPATYDAATRNWGDSWRMPKYKEMKELLDGCTWEWTADYEGTGVAGEIGTSKTNGKQIFFPAAGRTYLKEVQEVGKYGYYWTAEFDNNAAWDAYALNFDYYYTTPEIESEQNYIGHSVRAIVK